MRRCAPLVPALLRALPRGRIGAGLMRRCAPLVPALLRALPRGRLTAGAAVAFAVAWLLSAQVAGGGAVVGLKYAALALCLAVATILDDPADRTVAAVTLTLLRRRVATIALVAPGLAVAWAGVVSGTAIEGRSALALTLVLAALVLLTLALAVALPRGGAVAGPVVVLAFLGIDALGPRWVVEPGVGDWRWHAAWAGLAAVALLALLVSSRDPARRGASSISGLAGATHVARAR